MALSRWEERLIIGIIISLCITYYKARSLGEGRELIDRKSGVSLELSRITRGSSPIVVRSRQEAESSPQSFDSFQTVLDHVKPIIEHTKAIAIEKLKVHDRCKSRRNKHCPFESVMSFVSIGPPYVRQGSMQLKSEQKTLVDPAYLKRPCLLYGLGINRDSSFEMSMSSQCDVHAFDCTIAADYYPVRDKPFSFHQWCIGTETRIGDTLQAQKVQSEGHSLAFKSLQDTMKELNHSRIDYLKFDIEGSEWELLAVILALPTHQLPWSIMFELHTEGANPKAVPPETVAGKHRKEVNGLLLQLLDRGYGILDFTINPLDRACAEFSLVLID